MRALSPIIASNGLAIFFDNCLSFAHHSNFRFCGNIAIRRCNGKLGPLDACALAMVFSRI